MFRKSFLVFSGIVFFGCASLLKAVDDSSYDLGLNRPLPTVPGTLEANNLTWGSSTPFTSPDSYDLSWNYPVPGTSEYVYFTPPSFTPSASLGSYDGDYYTLSANDEIFQYRMLGSWVEGSLLYTYQMRRNNSSQEQLKLAREKLLSLLSEVNKTMPDGDLRRYYVRGLEFQLTGNPPPLIATGYSAPVEALILPPIHDPQIR